MLLLEQKYIRQRKHGTEVGTRTQKIFIIMRFYQDSKSDIVWKPNGTSDQSLVPKGFISL